MCTPNSSYDRIVLCKSCRQPEYWGSMYWLSGCCVCRRCYKARYEQETGKTYTWHDLDGPVPTMEDYNSQEGLTQQATPDLKSIVDAAVSTINGHVVIKARSAQ